MNHYVNVRMTPTSKVLWTGHYIGDVADFEAHIKVKNPMAIVTSVTFVHFPDERQRKFKKRIKK